MFIRIINSKDRKNGDYNEGTIQLEEPLSGAYNFSSFSTVNNIYNINSTNNQFTILVFFPLIQQWDISLDSGHYTPHELEIEIQKQIDQTGLMGDMVVTYNENQGTITYETTTATFKIVTNNDTLGLTDDTALAPYQTVTSNVLQLYPHLHFYIRFENSDVKVQWQKYINASLIIHNTAKFMEDLHYFPIETIPQSLQFKNVRTLRYKLIDENGQKLTLQDNWKLIITKMYST